MTIEEQFEQLKSDIEHAHYSYQKAQKVDDPEVMKEVLNTSAVSVIRVEKEAQALFNQLYALIFKD